MRIDHHHYIHGDPSQVESLNKIQYFLNTILDEVRSMKKEIIKLDLDFTELEKEVNEISTVEESAKTTLLALVAEQAILQKKLDDAIAANDPGRTAEAQAKLNAFADTLKNKAADLVAAIANVPVPVQTPPV